MHPAPSSGYARRVRPIALIPAAVMIAGCSYYDASLLDPMGTADSGKDVSLDAGEDAGDAGADGGEDAADAGDTTPADAACVHALPPDPPGVIDAGGDVDFVVAISTIDFGDGDGSEPREIGYDLDMRCTCPEANGCFREAWAHVDACDGPGGRDNMGGVFLAQAAALFPGLGSEAWGQDLSAGRWSVVLRVRNYNGEADDDRVRLDWYIPAPFEHVTADPPKWDGTDVWPIFAWSLVTPAAGVPWNIDDTQYFDDRAYVSDGMLVGSVSQATVQIMDDYAVRMTGGIFTANIAQHGGSWKLENGLMAGRWPTSSILAGVSSFEDPIFGLPICMDNPAYEGIKSQVCGFVDVFDGVSSPTTPCDSVSVGMRFETVPATLGPVIESGPPGGNCDDSVDPIHDSCETLGS